MSAIASSHSEFKGTLENQDSQDSSSSLSSSANVNWLQRIETSIAKSRKVRGGNYVQIATVDSEGFPHCRTVVFRGFLTFGGEDSTLAMKMITDARSEKMTHIQARESCISPAKGACEMVWWFSQSSEQYRIRGRLVAVSSDDGNPELISARKQQWGNLSDSAREQFFWKPPGQPFDGAPEVPIGGRDADGKVLPPPDSFILLLLIPESIKYLRLKDNLAMIDTLDKTDSEGGGSAPAPSWAFQRVNP